MNYRYLEAFLTAAKEKSFTKAASLLNITPAALGRQIRLLEESIGEQLIIRSPQSFVITPEGKALYEQVNALDGWAKNRYGTNSRNHIRIMAFQGIIENWLVEKFNNHETFKETTFTIIKGEPADTDKFLLEDKVDFAITNKSFQTDILTSLKIFDEEIVLISKDKIKLSEIGKHRWIITNPKDFIVNYAQKKSIEHIAPKTRIESIRASIRMVEKGLGISMVPKHLVQGNELIYYRKVSEFSSEPIYLTSLNYKKLPEYLNQFLKMVKSF